MHLHGIVLCSNNSDSDVLEVGGGGGATLGSLVNCMIYIMSKKISSNSVVEETVQLTMIGQHNIFDNNIIINTTVALYPQLNLGGGGFN